MGAAVRPIVGAGQSPGGAPWAKPPESSWVLPMFSANFLQNLRNHATCTYLFFSKYVALKKKVSQCEIIQHKSHLNIYYSIVIMGEYFQNILYSSSVLVYCKCCKEILKIKQNENLLIPYVGNISKRRYLYNHLYHLFCST